MAVLKGGEAFTRRLSEIAKGVKKGATLRIGWPENERYPDKDGTLVGLVAAIQEFGARATIPAHEQTVYRMLNKAQTEFLKGGRFVKKSKANWSETHQVAEYTVMIPPRPFMRNTINENSGDWVEQIANLLQANNYDAEKVMNMMGHEIVGQVQASIDKFVDPPNAPSTIRKKGFDKPLVDSKIMRKTVNFEVK